ncbi:MAG: FIST C-terminal domain-containing protein [Archangiaceae bacterium]|nr:FIST C-terminal domain-containing protein [Archangiaceae bacterium]
MGEAAQQLGGAASFGFVFASPRHDLGTCLRTAREVSPGTDFIGCTTAGEITERGLVHHGVATLLVAADQLQHQSGIASGVKSDPSTVASMVTRGFGDAMGAAKKAGLPYSTTVVLVDGLAGSGDQLVRELIKSTRAAQQVVGGAAGDEGAFSQTLVGDGQKVGPDTAAALHVFGRSPWGVGIGHGLRPTSSRMRVTRARQNVIYELDGRPAFDVYREHAKSRGVSLTAATAGPYLIGNELGVYLGDEIVRARAPLSVGSDGSLSCAANVGQGSTVCILDGEVAPMVSAARDAAKEARDNLAFAKPAGVLLFDCICRGMILKDNFSQEIAAIRAEFGAVPIAGFLTYGEIADYKNSTDGWHNTTAVVVAIPA